MLDWIVGRITDLLIAFVIATAVMWYALVEYPEIFPQHVVSYWESVIPSAAQQTHTAQVQPQ